MLSAISTRPTDATVRQPTEVLEQIFFRAIDPKNPVWFDALNATLAIGRVCKRWQGIVNGYQELWSTVTIARCMKEDWIETSLNRVGLPTFSLRIDARPYKGIRVGDNRLSRPVSSQSMVTFQSAMLPCLSQHFAKVQALTIEGVEEHSLASILRAISAFPSTTIKYLTIHCTVSVPTDAPLDLPPIGKIMHLKLHDFRPLWTSSQFYQAMTTVDLSSMSMDLKWAQLRFALGSMVALTDLGISNVSCTDWYDGPPLYLAELANLRVAYGGLFNIEWLQNLHVDKIYSFDLHLSVGASIAMAVTWVPHICGVARQVRLYTLDLTGPAMVPFLALFRSAISFDTRQSIQAFRQLARFLDAPNADRMMPLLEVLLVVGEVSVEEARTMLVGHFASLKKIHAKVSGNRNSGDYVEWTVEDQEVVYKYVRCD